MAFPIASDSAIQTHAKDGCYGPNRQTFQSHANPPLSLGQPLATFGYPPTCLDPWQSKHRSVQPTTAYKNTFFRLLGTTPCFARLFFFSFSFSYSSLFVASCHCSPLFALCDPSFVSGGLRDSCRSQVKRHLQAGKAHGAGAYSKLCNAELACRVEHTSAEKATRFKRHTAAAHVGCFMRVQSSGITRLPSCVFHMTFSPTCRDDKTERKKVKKKKKHWPLRYAGTGSSYQHLVSIKNPCAITALLGAFLYSYSTLC